MEAIHNLIIENIADLTYMNLIRRVIDTCKWKPMATLLLSI